MKALIAMSGGVDSSVAAKLTKEAGYECIGCTMRLFDADNTVDSDTTGTPSATDDARRVAEGIAAGCGTDAPGSFMAWLAATGRVYAMEMPGKRYDIGNLESYRKVCEEYRGIL